MTKVHLKSFKRIKIPPNLKKTKYAKKLVKSTKIPLKPKKWAKYLPKPKNLPKYPHKPKKWPKYSRNLAKIIKIFPKPKN